MKFDPNILGKFTDLVGIEILSFPSNGLPLVMQTTGGAIFKGGGVDRITNKVIARVVCISDNVPKEMQSYIVMHEAWCVPNDSTPGHCVAASRRVLDQVPDEDKKEYLEKIIPFLENIKKHLEDTSSGDTPEAQRSKKYAKEIGLSIVYLRTVLSSEINKAKRRTVPPTHLAGIPISDIKFPGTNS